MRFLLASVVSLLASVCWSQHPYVAYHRNYGAKANNATDIGPAIKSAFTNCIIKNPNSRLGNYLLSSTVLLNAGSNWAFQLDGLITVDYSAYISGAVAGNAFVFPRMNNFELYSSNGQGAIDECVSVKSPSKQATIENIRCNQSGGSSIGSLKDGSVIESILFQNIENYQVTNAFMLKTYPGGASPGYVKNVVLRNFTNIDVTYNAYITQYWQNSYALGASNVQLSNMTFSGWRGSVNHGGNRGAVVMIGSETNPPVNINVKNFSFWTVNGNSVVDRCSSTYGSGSCIKALPAKGSPTKYATVYVTATAAPAGWVTPKAPWGIPPYGEELALTD
ncbi:unnamed protein product [Rhizoctonia solani]|uniref:Glycoside hydrolase family 28 protein n=1 Tax=Rhizoctonia solani TaxID=456999 RepID=A0A8H3HNX3_9AGAM|nr:unnamed protein product [Rhizoctonia solani]